MNRDEAIRRIQNRAAAMAVLVPQVGQDLKAFRATQALTIVTVAAETGLSRTTVWRIENGKDVRMGCLTALLAWMGNRA